MVAPQKGLILRLYFPAKLNNETYKWPPWLFQVSAGAYDVFPKCDDLKNVCLRRLFLEKVPVTSFHEGKAKKAKPAKTVCLAQRPVNFFLVTGSFIVEF